MCEQGPQGFWQKFESPGGRFRTSKVPSDGEAAATWALDLGNSYLAGDVDGDGVADFLIRFDGKVDLTMADFIL